MDFWMLVPVTALMIPIVAILTAHQRRMAEIIHSNHGAQPGEIEALRHEIHELKQIVHQQAIALDNYTTRQLSPPPIPEMAKRLES